MNEKELKAFHEEKRKNKEKLMKAQNTIKTIRYMSKKPADFKGFPVKYGDKVPVNEIEYNDLIQNRHWCSEEHWNEFHTEQPKKKKKGRYVNPEEVTVDE